NNSVTSTKLKSKFIPAILYWGWENTIRCELDPIMVGHSFKESFSYYADTLNLREKTQGKKLEIKLEKIPNNFIYTNQGNTAIFIIAYTVNTIEAIIPQEQNLIVSYKLT